MIASILGDKIIISLKNNGRFSVVVPEVFLLIWGSWGYEKIYQMYFNLLIGSTLKYFYPKNTKKRIRMPYRLPPLPKFSKTKFWRKNPKHCWSFFWPTLIVFTNLSRPFAKYVIEPLQDFLGCNGWASKNVSRFIFSAETKEL